MSENDPGRQPGAEEEGTGLDLPTGSGGGPDGETAIATTSVEEALAEGEHLR
jgi:hypothetical protein